MVVTVGSVNGDYDADGWSHCIIRSCNMKGESVSQFNPCTCERSFNPRMLIAGML